MRQSTFVLVLALFSSACSQKYVAADIVLLFSDRQLDQPGLKVRQDQSLYNSARLEAAMEASKGGVSLAEAHYDLAVKLSQSGDMKDLAWKIVFHLEQAATGGFRTADSRASLGYIYLAAGDFPRAVENLSAVADEDPRVRLTYARALLAVSRPDLARKQGQLAERELKQRMDESSASDAWETQWIASLEFLERFDEAISHLEKKIQEEPHLLPLLLQVLTTQADVARRNGDVETEINCLCETLQKSPARRATMERILGLLERIPEMKSSQIAYVEERLTSASMNLHENLVIGSTLCEAGRHASGIRMLRKAHELDEADPAVLNNLAWYLSHQETPDLDEAMHFANLAVQQFPKRLEFLETRGQIHILRGDHDQAKDDLEKALTALPKHRSLHLGLAKVYEELGDSKRADKHRARADQLKELRK